MNPGITSDMERASGEAIKDNVLYEHFFMVFILNEYCTNLPKIRRNFESGLIVGLVVILACPMCVRFDCGLLLSRFLTRKINLLVTTTLILIKPERQRDYRSREVQRQEIDFDPCMS